MWKASSALLLGLLWPQEGPEPASMLVRRTDVSAVLRSWRITGVMACAHKGRVRKCLRVENAFPCGLLEIVQRPGASQILEALPWVAPIPTGGRHGEGNLRFGEARVASLVPTLVAEPGLPIAKPHSMGFRMSYVSEFDPIGWRVEAWDLLLNASKVPPDCSRVPLHPGCAGLWGSLYPRAGYVIHGSEPQAAALQALRAALAAHRPVGRAVVTPYPFEPRRGHFLQMLKPAWRPGVPIGYPLPPDWMPGSMSGSYLFMHLGIFEECARCLPARLVGPR